jgi:hypothetical protein
VTEWVRGGGAVVLVAGDPTQSIYLGETLLPALGFPAEARYRVHPAASAERTEITAPDHPLFAGIGSEARATLTEVNWYRSYDVPEGDAIVLLGLTGGAPLLLERRLGSGRVVLLASHLRREATDLAFSPMSLPIWQRLAAYLAWRGRLAAGSSTVGQPAVLPLSRTILAENDASELGPVRVFGPDGGDTPTRLRWQGDTPLLVGGATDRAGFYAFLADADTLGLIAAAVPARESLPALRSAETVADSLGRLGVRRVTALDEAAMAGFAAALQGRELGPWLLAAAALLLLLELHLGRGAERRIEQRSS